MVTNDRYSSNEYSHHRKQSYVTSKETNDIRQLFWKLVDSPAPKNATGIKNLIDVCTDLCNPLGEQR